MPVPMMHILIGLSVYRSAVDRSLLSTWSRHATDGFSERIPSARGLLDPVMVNKIELQTIFNTVG